MNLLRVFSTRTIRLGLLLAVLLAVLLVLGWIGLPYLSSSKGSTYGLIYIDTPEVYTRERLVNDRFQQEAWLYRQLNREVKFGVQASASNSSMSKTEFSVNSDANADLDEASAAISSPASPPVSATPLEQFRDELSYREEIRNELLENQLDDRHDIAGNTLYRLKFDSTVVPEHDTSAYAMVEVTIESPNYGPVYGNDLKDKRSSDIYAVFDVERGVNIDRYDLMTGPYTDWIENGPKTYLDPLVRLSQMDPDWLDRFQLVYINWMELLAIAGNDQMQSSQPAVNAGDANFDRERSSGIIQLCSQQNGLFNIVEIDGACGFPEDGADNIISTYPVRAPDLEYFGDWNNLKKHIELRGAVVKMLFGEARSCATAWVESHPEVELSVIDLDYDYINSIISEMAASGIAADNCDQLASIIGELLDTASPENPMHQDAIQKSLQEFIADLDAELAYDFDTVYRSANDWALFTKFEAAAKELGLINPDKPLASLVKVIVDETGGLMNIETGLANFIIRLIESKGAVYTYAVTPKERVQRISRDTRMMQSMGLAGGAEQQGISGSLTHAAERTAQLNQISRQPLLVGYSPPTETGSAGMGWLMGPRFQIPASASANVNFRHVPSQNTLTGIISVPSWWKELTMSTATYWLNESGEVHGKTERGNIEVSLPGDLQSVTDTLLPHLEALKPIIDQDSIKGVVLNACERGAIVIRGAHLWRSTVVTLGSQQANAITVLPSMNGIIAEFDYVNLPPEPVDIEQKDQKIALELVVWTSEGEDAAKEKIMIDGAKNCDGKKIPQI